MHELGLNEVERIAGKMRQVSFTFQLYNRCTNWGSRIAGKMRQVSFTFQLYNRCTNWGSTRWSG